MAVTTRIMYSDSELTGTANDIKELVVADMMKKGIISIADGEGYLCRNAILVVKKGWLGSAIDRTFGLTDQDRKVFMIVDTKR